MSKIRNIKFLKGLITRFSVKSEDIDSVTIYSLKHFVDERDATFNEFKSYYEQLEMDDKSPIEIIEEFGEYEERYLLAKSRFSEAIDRKLNRSVNDTIDVSRNPDRSLTSILEKQTELLELFGNRVHGNKTDRRLPVVKVPRFSGKFSEWTRFKNLFLNVVDGNNDLTSVEKLSHLMGLLDGEAAEVICHYPLTEENYETAWNSLTDNYEKPFLIVAKLIKEFISIPVVDSKKINLKGCYNNCGVRQR